MDGDALVRDYLVRLEAAAWPLRVDRRAELVGEVREHVATAVGEAGRSDEVTVRNVLERLGPPEEIVAAEMDAGEDAGPWRPGQPPVAVAVSSWGAVEIIALLLLTVGAFVLPFIGPLIGLVFVWASTRWTTRHKLIATGIVVLLFVLPIIGLLSAGFGSAAGM